VPQRLWRGGHRQTIASYLSRRHRHLLREFASDEARYFQTEPGVQVLAHCHWQEQRTNHPTLVLVHGLEGSSSSVYMLGTESKAHAAGFNVVRLNMRNCGATEHLTPTLYNSGLTGDLRFVLDELMERDGLSRFYCAGFSMGGNVVLKLAGEFGSDAPSSLAGFCAVSPSLDLAACARRIEHPSNRLYQSRFVRSLRRRMRYKHKLFPETYDIKNLRRIRTVRDFDENFTAPHFGYADASDYYARASALRFIAAIRLPTLIITAQDDPFVPFASFTNEAISDNPHVHLLAPSHGGHVGFIASHAETGGDRFWAEHRIIEFCRLIDDGASQLA